MGVGRGSGEGVGRGVGEGVGEGKGVGLTPGYDEAEAGVCRGQCVACTYTVLLFAVAFPMTVSGVVFIVLHHTWTAQRYHDIDFLILGLVLLVVGLVLLIGSIVLILSIYTNCCDRHYKSTIQLLRSGVYTGFGSVLHGGCSTIA